MNKIAIIAGGGNLPVKLKEHLLNNKLDFVIFAIIGEADSVLLENVKDYLWINIGELGFILRELEKREIKQIVFAGKVNKPNLLNLKVDSLGAKFLARLVKAKFLGDDTILSSLTKFLEEKKFEVLGAQQIMQGLTTKAENFTVLAPDEQDNIDIELGIKLLNTIGELDIGQSVVIENAMILAVEAIEGTDEMLKRAAQLKRSLLSSGVMVKSAKINQELRMDLPTIGLNTIKNAYLAKLKGILIQAEKTIFLDQDEVINFADRHRMFVCAKIF